jgi:hypothetical protein
MTFPAPPRLRRPDVRLAERLVMLAVGIAAFVLARAALLPGVWFWDTAEAQTVGPLLGVMHPTGFPAYVVMGWLASFAFTPFGDPAFRMNLLSAVLVAAAAGLTVAIARRLGAPLAVSAAAGFALATTPIVWSVATHADAHALHLALIALEVFLLVGWEARVRGRSERGETGPDRATDRRLLAAAAVFGIAVANHSLALLLAPCVAVAVLVVDPGVLRRPRFVLTAIGLSLGVALLLYLQLPLRAGPFRAPLVYGHPETLPGFLYVVLGQQFGASVSDPLADLSGTATDLVGLIGDQFGPLALFLPAGFIASIRLWPGFGALSGLGVVVTTVFAVSYRNAMIDRYYLVPILFCWLWLAVLATVVIRQVFGQLDWAASPDDAVEPPAGLTGGWTRSTLSLALAAVMLVPLVATWPARWADVDRSQDTSGPTWLDQALTALPRDAVVVSWWSYSTTLWYGQLIEGRRPDLLVIDDRTRLDLGLGDENDVIDSYFGRRPVYVIQTEGDLRKIEQRWLLSTVGEPTNLYRVLARAGS